MHLSPSCYLTNDSGLLLGILPTVNSRSFMATEKLSSGLESSGEVVSINLLSSNSWGSKDYIVAIEDDGSEESENWD